MRCEHFTLAKPLASCGTGGGDADAGDGGGAEKGDEDGDGNDGYRGDDGDDGDLRSDLRRAAFLPPATCLA